MQVNVSNIVFNFSTTTPGQVDSANFTFYGSDAQTGEFLNNTVRVDKTELPEGTTFFYRLRQGSDDRTAKTAQVSGTA